MRAFYLLSLPLAVGSGADAGTVNIPVQPIPAELEFCSGLIGVEEEFDKPLNIKGLTDYWLHAGESCVRQSEKAWIILDCNTGHILNVLTHRSAPNKWSTEPAVDVDEPIMSYRNLLRKSGEPVSFDKVTQDLRALGAEVTRQTIDGIGPFCAQM